MQMILRGLQRLQWLRSQALTDADDLIADILAAVGNTEAEPVLAANNA